MPLSYEWLLRKILKYNIYIQTFVLKNLIENGKFENSFIKSFNNKYFFQKTQKMGGKCFLQDGVFLLLLTN